jgi:hypothetical protein
MCFHLTIEQFGPIFFGLPGYRKKEEPNQSKQPPLAGAMTSSQHIYEVGPRKDHRGVNLISVALLFGRLWYGEPNAIRERNQLCEVLQPVT